MKIEKLYDEIKEYEITKPKEVLQSKGDLYIKHSTQLMKHYLDQIDFEVFEKFIVIYSPKMDKWFKIPDKNIKNIQRKEVDPNLFYFGQVSTFGYVPVFPNYINDEYVWDDKHLHFYLEVLHNL